MHTAVIVDVVRTPSGRGKPGGALSEVHPVELLATAIRAVIERTGIDPSIIEDVMAGCVTQVGDQAANIARSAALQAGLPEHVPGVTMDRQCGSSQQSAAFAAQGVMAGVYDVVLAVGVESMSRAPMFSAVGGGSPFGPLLADRYAAGLPDQGYGAEMIAAHWNLTRAELDEFSARSHLRAAAARDAGLFDNEIIPVQTHNGLVTHDETIRDSTTVESLASLDSPFYSESMAAKYPEIEWQVTAGSASPLTDGASAALIMSEDKARELGLTPRAKFHSLTVVGSDPVMMLTGPIPATEKILKKSGLSLDDIGVFEVNEAFAPVPLAWARELGVDEEKLNPRGGAIALGHPMGASGIRLLATMVNHMETNQIRYGLQTMCEGAGMANATIIELVGDAA